MSGDIGPGDDGAAAGIGAVSRRDPPPVRSPLGLGDRPGKEPWEVYVVKADADALPAGGEGQPKSLTW